MAETGKKFSNKDKNINVEQFIFHEFKTCICMLLYTLNVNMSSNYAAIKLLKLDSILCNLDDIFHKINQTHLQKIFNESKSQFSFFIASIKSKFIILIQIEYSILLLRLEQNIATGNSQN